MGQEPSPDFWLWPWCAGLFVVCLATNCLIAAPAQNLALGKPVTFTPAPNCEFTAKGDTDGTGLTDGKLSTRQDSQLWFDRACVGWSYFGLAQLSLDLGKPEPIGEVAMRLQGGSSRAGIAFPGWIDLVASLDGKTFHRIASCSKWTAGDRVKCGVLRDEGKGVGSGGCYRGGPWAARS